MKEYPKISGPYKRYTEGPERNKLIMGTWAKPEFEVLQDVAWLFTEKIDGTNIRVHWDGHRVTFGGRTDNAQIPAKLVTVLNGLFPEELLEQVFGRDEITLYGEGYGAGIQSGGIYRPDMSFTLFDVLAGKWWLERANVNDVARSLGIDRVPVMMVKRLGDLLGNVQSHGAGMFQELRPEYPMEGLVGVPDGGLLTRGGERIMIKIKRKDFVS